MQVEMKTERMKIVIVGEGAAEFIAARASEFSGAELIALDHPPSDNTPFVFADPEKQHAKAAAEARRKIMVDSPDPTEPDKPTNRHERRRLNALRKAQRKD